MPTRSSRGEYGRRPVRWREDGAARGRCRVGGSALHGRLRDVCRSFRTSVMPVLEARHRSRLNFEDSSGAAPPLRKMVEHFSRSVGSSLRWPSSRAQSPSQGRLAQTRPAAMLPRRERSWMSRSGSFVGWRAGMMHRWLGEHPLAGGVADEERAATGSISYDARSIRLGDVPFLAMRSRRVRSRPHHPPGTGGTARIVRIRHSTHCGGDVRRRASRESS